MTGKRLFTEDAAYSKGKQGYVDGRGRDDSPYSGRLRDAWEDGWDAQQKVDHDAQADEAAFLAEDARRY